MTPYRAKSITIALDEMNPLLPLISGRQRYWAEKSLELDLDEVDEADEDTFNRILWHYAKGYDTPFPEHLRRDDDDD